VPEEPTVRFYETAANTPPAVRSWWYPGIRGGGHEFIYPHDQATELARMNADGVLSTAGPEDSAAVTRVRASDADAAGVAERAEPAQPRAEAAERADVERPAPAVARDAADRDMAMSRQNDADMASPRTALPRTATERGWFAAIGFLSVIAGVVLMGRRRAV
jgi:hypothetical protein